MPKKKSEPAPPFVRRKCDNCNHAESFHPDHEECCAFGCQCPAWVPPAESKPKAKGKVAK